MNFDVQLVNFPKSTLIRTSVSDKISDCVQKFSQGVSSVKAFFSMDGIDHHIKISVIAGKTTTCVNASATDLTHSIELVVNKLESALRKTSTKRKHLRSEFSLVSETSDYNATNLRAKKRIELKQESVFDKFETHYISNFEDTDRRA